MEANECKSAALCFASTCVLIQPKQQQYVLGLGWPRCVRPKKQPGVHVLVGSANLVLFLPIQRRPAWSFPGFFSCDVVNPILNVTILYLEGVVGAAIDTTAFCCIFCQLLKTRPAQSLRAETKRCRLMAPWFARQQPYFQWLGGLGLGV